MRREDLDFGQSAESHGALAGPHQSEPAVFATAQSPGRVKNLIGLGEHPGRRPRGQDFYFALEFDNADFYCWPAWTSRLSEGSLVALREAENRRKHSTLPKAGDHEFYAR